MLIVSLLALAVAAGLASAKAADRVAVHGLVKQALTGTCAEGEACDGLARHVRLAFSRGGHVVARAETNAEGRYRVRLRPGWYSVRVVEHPGERVRPARVKVHRPSTRANLLVGDYTRP